MRKKIQDTAKARSEHRSDLVDFEASIPPNVLTTWRETVMSWETNADSPNPYKSDSNGTLYII